MLSRPMSFLAPSPSAMLGRYGRLWLIDIILTVKSIQLIQDLSETLEERGIPALTN
jgi:hypothetical protein